MSVDKRIVPLYTLEVVYNPECVVWEYVCALADTEAQCIRLAELVSCQVGYSRIYTLRKQNGVLLQYVVGVYRKGELYTYTDGESNRRLKCGWVF